MASSFLLLAACFGDVEPEQASDEVGAPKKVCDYSPAENPAGCPEEYSRQVWSGVEREADGLVCMYPGRGDSTSSTGCRTPALLYCQSRGDAGPPAWAPVQ